MSSPDPWRPATPSSQATASGGRIAEADLAAIIRRAAALGIPAWRITTALGLRTD